MLTRHPAPRRLASLLLLPLLLASAQASAWVNTKTQAMPLSKAVPMGAVSPTMPMRVTVGLKLRNREQLESFIEHLTTEGDPAYGQLMSDATLAANHLPTAAQARAVTDYLAAQGFQDITLAPNRLMISASATASVVQKAFHTSLVQYKAGTRTVFTNVTAAQVPDALGNIVLHVSGLNNVALFRGHMNRLAPPDAFSTFLGYGPRDFQTAYQAVSTPTGSGVTIGIIMSGRTASVLSDLAIYRAHFGMSPLTAAAPYLQSGSESSDDAGLGEWDMDTQTSTGIAEFAGLKLYVAASLTTADLAVTINHWAGDSVSRVASASLGICEVLPFLTGDMEAIDGALATAVARGKTLFASTGDAGSACSVVINLGVPLSGPPMQEYPATSPYAVGVGGTTLLVDATYHWNNELVWNGTGGGPSYFESAPNWQSGKVAGAAAGRAIPDISLDADPNTPAIVYEKGAETYIGGTSLSSPLAAGMWARILTARSGLGFAAPYFYRLVPGVKATSPTQQTVANSGLHDIVVGCNGFYCATPRWDYASGVGTPAIDKLAVKIH